MREGGRKRGREMEIVNSKPTYRSHLSEKAKGQRYVHTLLIKPSDTPVTATTTFKWPMIETERRSA